MEDHRAKDTCAMLHIDMISMVILSESTSRRPGLSVHWSNLNTWTIKSFLSLLQGLSTDDAVSQRVGFNIRTVWLWSILIDSFHRKSPSMVWMVWFYLYIFWDPLAVGTDSIRSCNVLHARIFNGNAVGSRVEAAHHTPALYDRGEGFDWRLL